MEVLEEKHTHAVGDMNTSTVIPHYDFLKMVSMFVSRVAMDVNMDKNLGV